MLAALLESSTAVGAPKAAIAALAGYVYESRAGFVWYLTQATTHEPLYANATDDAPFQIVYLKLLH